MEKILLQILNNIYNEIEGDNTLISLMGGGTGVALFKIYYLKYVKKNDLNEDIIYSLQELSEASINYNNISSFCNGQAGINWFFNLLYNLGYIEKKDFKIITSNDFSLAQVGLDNLSVGFYDFLHGGVGIAHYLLCAKNEKLIPFFGRFLDGLHVLMNKESSVVNHFDFDLRALIPNKVNPGLSHGLASILKICMECYKHGICRKKSKNIASRIIKFFLENASGDKTISYFPNIYDFGNKYQKNSSLSWCYGDLGIAYVMFQYGLMFKDEQVKIVSLEILHHCANRRADLEIKITDACLCHGSSGVAHIFSKLWYNTHDPKFQDAANYWFQKTIDYSMHKDGIAGYKATTYNAEKSALADSSLLMGVAGIGLAILSHLFQDYSWDYCLMLND
jgi:hypothetical protein